MSRLGSSPRAEARARFTSSRRPSRVDQRLADRRVLEGRAEALLGLAEVALALVAVGHVGDHGDHRGDLVAVEHRGGGEDRPELAAVAAAEADVVELAAVAAGAGRTATPPASGRCRRPSRGAAGLRSSSGSQPSSSAMRRLVKVVRPSVSMTHTPRWASSRRRSSSPVDPRGGRRSLRVGRRVAGAADLHLGQRVAGRAEHHLAGIAGRARAGGPGPPSLVRRRWPRSAATVARAAGRELLDVDRRRFEARCPAGAEGSRRMRHVPFHIPPAELTSRSSFPSCTRADRTCRMVPTSIGAVA